MGWFSRLMGGRDTPQPQVSAGTSGPHPLGAAPTTTLTPTRPPSSGYAVIDVETTGLSPRAHRVVSMAVVLMDAHGRSEYEWATLVNPQGPVGATHIHGITDRDVANAPTFEQLVPDLIGLLHARVVVGHNVSFDVAFLKYEFGRAGWSWPTVPTLCTLEGSFTFLPGLDRRRLADCCWAADIPLTDTHSALGDARATAGLFASYLAPQQIAADLGYGAALGLAAATNWPTAPGTGRIADPSAPRRALSTRAWHVMAMQPERRLTLLESFTLTDARDDGAPEGTMSYLETLAEVLEDGQITAEEQSVLQDVVELYELSDADVSAAHTGLVRALARQAMSDGVLAQAERAELRHIADLLDVPERAVKDLLNGEEEARLVALSTGLAPLPTPWSLGEPLHVGERVAFTGCDDLERDALEQRARSRGVYVTGSVSRRTVLLVTDGSFYGNKAAAADELGTRCVLPAEFALLLDHLQPVMTTRSAARPVAAPPARRRDIPTDMTSTTSSPNEPAPADIRAWARAQGYDIGVRGRISAEIRTAYLNALPASDLD